MPGSHTSTFEGLTPREPDRGLQLLSTVSRGLLQQLAGAIDGHLATSAERAKERLLADSTAVGLEVMAEMMEAEQVTARTLAGISTRKYPVALEPMMEHIRNWFRKHAPSALGAVVSVIVNPVVGKLAAAGGDVLAAEFTRRFGSERTP